MMTIFARKMSDIDDFSTFTVCIFLQVFLKSDAAL